MGAVGDNMVKISKEKEAEIRKLIVMGDALNDVLKRLGMEPEINLDREMQKARFYWAVEDFDSFVKKYTEIIDVCEPYVKTYVNAMNNLKSIRDYNKTKDEED